VTRVRVEAVPSDGEHMTPGYHYIEERDGRTVAAPIETMRVKSLILAPRDGERRAAGVARVTGYAWGGRPVTRVEVSADGGRTLAMGLLAGPATGRTSSPSWAGPYQAFLQRWVTVVSATPLVTRVDYDRLAAQRDRDAALARVHGALLAVDPAAVDDRARLAWA